jgi:hypothetical protein
MGEIKLSKKLNIAVIDESPGNGHMFSFSSLFNGYDPNELANCPFPAIRQYLPTYELPREKLHNLAVVSQTRMNNSGLDATLKRFLKLPAQVKSWETCVYDSDCVIITNDVPSENRKGKILFALAQGKQVFVDKVLARNKSEIDQLITSQLYEGQLFAGSGVPFAPCFDTINVSEDTLKLKIEIPKTWSQYGIHGVELAIRILGQSAALLRGVEVLKTNRETRLKLHTENLRNLEVEIVTTGLKDTPISVTIVEGNQTKEIIMSDPLFAFERMLDCWLSPEKRFPTIEYERYLIATQILAMAE